MFTFSKVRRLALGLSVPVVLLGTAAVAVVGFRPSLPWASAQTPGSGCRFLSSPNATPAFCDTFDQPAGTGNRSGDLNGTVWGVSRIIAGGGDNYSSGTNPSQGQVDTFAPVGLDKCGTTTTVYPDRDVAICNGQVVEGVNDDGGQTVLAMYPKQPFDIAGRTGTVVFDVSADSQGPHAAWPSFAYTDQPVPAPYGLASGIETSARNSIGFSLNNICGAGNWCGNHCPSSGGVTVGDFYKTVNSVRSDVNFTVTGCVQEPTSPTQLNHFEVKISSTGVQVYGTDPGGTNLVELATASFNVPLTRGLLWMEDTHYNADKFNNQQSHTFGWDNFGFDGPVLPRDLAFDAPENKTLNVDSRWPGKPGMQLGWVTSASGTAVQVPGVYNVSQASAALVTFNWMPTSQVVPSISVNGNPYISTPWPFTSTTYEWRTIAVPVPLSEIKAGSNTITFKEGNGDAIANVDLILVGAGGVPSGGTSPAAAPTSTSTSSSTSTAPAHISINNAACTITQNGVQKSGTCSGTFTPNP